jgi:hypothetical protein
VHNSFTFFGDGLICADLVEGWCTTLFLVQMLEEKIVVLRINAWNRWSP